MDRMTQTQILPKFSGQFFYLKIGKVNQICLLSKQIPKESGSEMDKCKKAMLKVLRYTEHWWIAEKRSDHQGLSACENQTIPRKKY